jgi:hypothetical protein
MRITPTSSQQTSLGARPRTRTRSGERIVIDAWQRRDGARVHQTVIRDAAVSAVSAPAERKPVQILRNVTSSDGRILETIIATLDGATRGEGISSRSWFEGDGDRMNVSVYETYGARRVLLGRRVHLADDRTRASVRVAHTPGKDELVVEVVAGRASLRDLDALLTRARTLAHTALRAARPR